MKYHLFADGGVISKNPSPYGGTYAFVLIKKDGRGGDEVLEEQSGIVAIPEGFDYVTNNLTEMVAVYYGLREFHDYYDFTASDEITVYSDSQMTLNRVFGGDAWNGIPGELREAVMWYAEKLQSRLKVSHVLLAGHPNKKELEQGFKIKKSGSCYPVSKWNVLCDTMCRNESIEYFRRERENG